LAELPSGAFTTLLRLLLRPCVLQFRSLTPRLGGALRALVRFALGAGEVGFPALPGNLRLLLDARLGVAEGALVVLVEACPPFLGLLC
jgi:hypothetical protein